jgi:ABC-type oligopeptide transport system substrate-binding subunit
MRTRLLAVLISASLALTACATEDKETADTEPEDDGTTDVDTDAGSGDTDTDEGPDCIEGLLEGDCAPDFTLPDADGVDRSLSDFEGQRVVIIGTAEW